MGNLSAVYAMWKREMIRFTRSKSRIIGSIGMPFFFLAIVGSGLGGAFSMPGMEGGYMEFIAPGMVAMTVLFGSIFSGVTVIMDRQFGFLKETLVAPVSRLSIVAGRALGGATTATLQGLLMVAIAAVLGVPLQAAGLPLAVVFMFFSATAFVFLGIAIASLMEDMHGFQLVMNLLVMPMFFLSGAIFPLESAPEIVRYIGYIDPMTYTVEALRTLLVGQAGIPLAACAGAIAALLAAFGLAASCLFGKIEG